MPQSRLTLKIRIRMTTRRRARLTNEAMRSPGDIAVDRETLNSASGLALGICSIAGDRCLQDKSRVLLLNEAAAIGSMIARFTIMSFIIRAKNMPPDLTFHSIAF